ncbi:hypothetical protein Tco_1150368 [Tanacetum coccineum]
MEPQVTAKRASTSSIKSPKEILATEKAAKAFEQPSHMIMNRRSRDMTKYYHFHEDHGHETNQCHELRHQIEEVVKSVQLAHLVKGIKKGNAKAFDTQLGEWKKRDKDIIPSKAPNLMVNREGYTLRRKSAEEAVNRIGEITFPLSKSPYNLLLRRTAMQKMGIVVSTIHAAIKFHTPYMEEKIIVNDKHPEHTIVIGKQLPTSFKRKLQDLLRSNVTVFACTYANMIGIPRTIIVRGKLVNTEHKLNEYKHIEQVKRKKRVLAPEQNEAVCKEVNELTKAGILCEVKYHTWVANLVMVKKSYGG